MVEQLLETSIPGIVMLHIAQNEGAADAFTTPSQLGFGAIVVMSAIRLSPRLSVVAGVVAAIEMTAVWWWLRGGLPAGQGLVALMPIGVAMRAVVLVLCGVGAAQIARYVLKRTEEALEATRSQDLMAKYVLHERLGEGGMGEIFRAAYCPEGGFVKAVALKRLPAKLSADPRFVELLKAEARTGAMLSHPNIVQVLDCGRFRGNFILVMELVDGVALSALLREQRGLELSVVTFIASELAEGLDYLHSRRGPDGKELGLVHRDVNAPNVLVSRIGEVKLTDFGVAHATRCAAVDGFAGKLDYAAPEQLAGHPLDARVDLFGLGLTMWELLAGRRAYEVEKPLPRASSLRAGIPPELEALVMQLIEPRADLRPSSAAEVRARLEALPQPVRPSSHGEALLAETVARLMGAAPKPQAPTVLKRTDATVSDRRPVT